MTLDNDKNISIDEFSIVKYVKNDVLLSLWLSSCFEKRVKKKKLINININTSVKEIIKIVNVENEWIPLRISSGLLSGVVKVYHYKVEYLDSKCNHILTRMQNYNRNLIHNASTNILNETSKTNLELDIEKPRLNRTNRDIVDIEEINKTLEIINDDSINQLEVVPLSQVSRNSHQLMGIDSIDSENLNNSSLELFQLDIEFEDFVENDKVNEVEVENQIEKIRGESTLFEDVLARGLEEVDLNSGKKIHEIQNENEELTIDDQESSHTSINMLNSSEREHINRNSIGALSSALDFIQNDENRISISNEGDSFFDRNINTLPIEKDKEPTEIKIVKQASINRFKKKRKKLIEIPLDKELKYSKNLYDENYIEKFSNFIALNKNSNTSIFSINNISKKVNHLFLLNLTKKDLSNLKNFGSFSKKRNFSDINLIETNHNESELYTNDSQILHENEIVENFDVAEKNTSFLTPVRGGRKIDEDKSECEDELIFTPWTKYIGSEKRKNIESLGTGYNDEKTMESIFSSREAKTMHYLNLKFLKNKYLSFDDLVKNSDPFSVAPIFVQILHLKSKSMINIEQKESFGEIIVYPV